MAQYVGSNTTLIKETLVNTGEITINLNLTIKLDSDGLKIDAQTVPNKIKPKVDTFNIDDQMLIPDIEVGEIIDFGRKVN